MFKLVIFEDIVGLSMGSNKFYCKLGEGIVRCPCPCAPNDGGCGSCPTWYYFVLGILGGIGILGFYVGWLRVVVKSWPKKSKRHKKRCKLNSIMQTYSDKMIMTLIKKTKTR